MTITPEFDQAVELATKIIEQPHAFLFHRNNEVVRLAQQFLILKNAYNLIEGELHTLRTLVREQAQMISAAHVAELRSIGRERSIKNI